MGVQLGDRPPPSGTRATNYDARVDSRPETKREKPLLVFAAIIFGLGGALVVAWGIRAYVMPSNKVNVVLRMTPPLNSQTALKLDGKLISSPNGVLVGVTLDKPHRLEIYQPHYIPSLHDFTLRYRNDEKYELEAKLVPLAKE